jgi:hypothetical protein
MRPEADIDQPPASLQALVPAVPRVRLEEGDQLEVRAIRERDQRVVSADGMAAAGHHGEAERAIAGHSGLELGDDDDQMIDTRENDTLLERGGNAQDGTGISPRCQGTREPPEGRSPQSRTA